MNMYTCNVLRNHSPSSIVNWFWNKCTGAVVRLESSRFLSWKKTDSTLRGIVTPARVLNSNEMVMNLSWDHSKNISEREKKSHVPSVTSAPRQWMLCFMDYSSNHVEIIFFTGNHYADVNGESCVAFYFLPQNIITPKLNTDDKKSVLLSALDLYTD